MATRQVTTVFAVEGERDYKQAIQNINRDIQTLNAKLDLNATHFKGQEDSMLAIEKKAEILNDLYFKQEEKVNKIRDAWTNCKDSAEKYRQKIEDTQKAIDEAKKKLDEMDKAGIGKDDDRYKSVRESYEKLTKTLSNEQAKFDAAVRGAQNWETALYNAQKNLEETARELKPIATVLDEQITPDFVDAGDAAHDAGEKSVEMKNTMSGAVEAAATLVATAGLDKAFEKVRDAMQACIDKSVQFETDVAGVFKTVDLTAEEESAMSAAIKELSTRIPATTTEIAGVAEAAGQLGIAKDDILEFTEVMLMMGTATNVGSIEAAESLAKFSNITKVKAEDYEKLGSVIVDLGNKNATTESEIIELATRMASTGDLVGMSATDMLAYAAALHSAGIEAESGGTAISKLFKQVEKAVELNKAKGVENKFAGIAGISSEEFGKLWDEDAAKALNKFLGGLGKLGDEGESVVMTLLDMNISEQRLSNAVQALASDEERLNKIFNEANQAWEEGTALSDEAERRYETSASKLQILENAFDNFQTAIGDDYMATLEPIIEGLTNLAIAGSGLAEEEPGFSTALAAIGGGLGAITAVTSAAAIIKGVAGALALFGPHAAGIAVGAAAIGALATGIYTLVQNSNGVSESVQAVLDANDKILEKTQSSTTIYDANKQAAEENSDKVNLLIEKLWAFHEEANKTPADHEIIKGVVDQLNELLPGLGLTYDSVTEKINLTRQEMQKFADDAANQKMLDALNGYMDALLKDNIVLEVQSRETDYAIEAAQKRYEDAVAAFENLKGSHSFFDELASLFGGESQYDYSRQYEELSKEVKNAKKELDELEKSAEELNTQLAENKEKTENASKAYNDMVAELGTEAETAAQAGQEVGEAFADGMIAGMDAKEEELRRKSRELAKIPETETRDGLEIRSPSKVAKRLGGYFGEGLAVGLSESEEEVARAAASLAGKFDISGELAEQYRAAQSRISSMRELGKPDNRIDFDAYGNQMREMNRSAAASAAYASGMNRSEREANITIIQQLDGKEISREVSRVQFNDTKITARARGVR